jgi:nucleoside-diphosphate-sugar epimerase
VRVLLIGSTGVLGREAVPRLLAAGHDVTGLARNPDRAVAVRGLGIEPVVGDLFDVDSMAKALAGREAVINLATRVPTTAGAMLRGGWAEHNRVRSEGSRVLVEAALTTDVRVLVQEGVAFVYADGGDAELDEDAPLGKAGMLQASLDAHANAARFAADSGRVGIGLRFALLIGDEPYARQLVRLAKRRLPVFFGDPDGWMTVVNPPDAAAAAVAALTAPGGAYNIGATPVRKRDFGRVVAEVAGVPKARSVPGWLARGPFESLARSQRIVSRRLTEATGWRPQRAEFGPHWLPGRRPG